MRVYLAGSLESRYQDLVKRVEGPEYLDPRHTAEVTCKHCYVPLEMGMIMLADVVIVYCEKDLLGLNRLVELGLAAGQGKLIVLIDNADFAPQMAQVIADYLFAGEDALGDFLKWWAEFAGGEEKRWQVAQELSW